MGNGYFVEGRTGEVAAQMNVPGPGYFKALGLRVRAGRVFDDRDDGRGERVAVVNQSFARAAWGTTDVLGRRLRDSEQKPWVTVVGVVDDIRVGSLEAPAPPVVFEPQLQGTTATMSSFVVRTSGNPYDAVPLVRDAVRSLDPELAVATISTLEERLSKVIAPRLFNAWLIGVFSLIAVILAVVGVYGLISETVASRTPEIGVRMALGATRFQMVRLVVGTSVVAMAIGVTLGLATAAAAGRSLGTLIFGVPPIDPLTLIVMPAMFIAIAGLASLAAARRAMRIDPVSALRND
jgi:hypothetical protein